MCMLAFLFCAARPSSFVSFVFSLLRFRRAILIIDQSNATMMTMISIYNILEIGWTFRRFPMSVCLCADAKPILSFHHHFYSMTFSLSLHLQYIQYSEEPTNVLWIANFSSHLFRLLHCFEFHFVCLRSAFFLASFRFLFRWIWSRSHRKGEKKVKSASSLTSTPTISHLDYILSTVNIIKWLKMGKHRRIKKNITHKQWSFHFRIEHWFCVCVWTFLLQPQPLQIYISDTLCNELIGISTNS